MLFTERDLKHIHHSNTMQRCMWHFLYLLFFHHYHRRDREKVDSFSMRQHWSSDFMFIAELNSMFEMVSKNFMRYFFLNNMNVSPISYLTLTNFDGVSKQFSTRHSSFAKRSLNEHQSSWKSFFGKFCSNQRVKKEITEMKTWENRKNFSTRKK